MRIGIDARFYNESGVGRYIRNLIQQLSVIDTKNEYIVYLLPKDFIDLHLPKQFTKRNAPITWHSVSEQFKLPSLINKDGIDLMHFPYFSLPIWYKGPYVMTIHDLILHSFPTGKASTKSPFMYYSKWLGYRFIMQQAANNASHIITVSNATKLDIQKKLKIPEQKITVTYEGVDENLADKPELSPLQAPKYKYFLHVGNVFPHKNAERLLEAFAHALYDIKEPMNLVFVGKDDYFSKRLSEQVQRLGLQTHVRIVGPASDESLYVLYKNATATVIPSLMEGFGLPALEAMAQNCLVIASDIPVMREICQDAAIYMMPTEVDSMAFALTFVANAKPHTFDDRKELGIELVKQFSWKKMAEETLAVYESSTRIRSR